MTRRRWLALLAAAALAAAVVPEVSLGASAKRTPDLQVLGFSVRGNGKLTSPGDTLEARNCKPRNIFGFASLKGVPNGRLVYYTWSFKGKLVARFKEPWSSGRKRTTARTHLGNFRGLPRGVYRLAVRVPGKGSTAGSVTLAC